MTDQTKLLAVTERGELERGELVVLFGHDGVFHGETFGCPENNYDTTTVLSWLAERWIVDERPVCFTINHPECVRCYLHFLQMRSYMSLRLGDRLLMFLEAQLSPQIRREVH